MVGAVEPPPGPARASGTTNTCSAGARTLSATVAGDSNEEVVEDLEVEIKKELVDGYVGIRSASNRYPGAL